MKKNPGRRERRHMAFQIRREDGKRRGKLHDHILHQESMRRGK